MRCVITGGAGFIGSHLVDSLLKDGHDVLVIDNLSSGKREYVNPSAGFIKADINSDLSSSIKGADAVFHFAADPDVRASADNPEPSFRNNVVGTYSVLESCRKADVKSFVLASTSTVYGETETIPTPETQPCFPISNYAASKLANEAYLSSFCGSYGLRGTVVRYANIFGERSTHGVMIDFYNKLKKNPHELKILGNGKQDKSYLHVSDCVRATILAQSKQAKNFDVFNIGSRKKVTVSELASLMCNRLNISPKFSYSGSERGWVGDVKLMLLQTNKIESLGWHESLTFEQGLDRYISWLSSLEKQG